MTKQSATLIIKSKGSFEFFFSSLCEAEVVGDVTSITFGDVSLNPPSVLGLAVSEKTFSICYADFQEDMNVETRLEFIDFNGKEGQFALKIDFEMFCIHLFRENAVFKKTESNILMQFKGFLTKEDRKTEDMQFIVEIRIV